MTDYDKLEERRQMARSIYYAQLAMMGYDSSGNALDSVKITRCRNCKHRPEYDPPYSRNECDLVFPDDVCPMKCGDNWYSKRMPDDFFCAAGEGG